MEENHISKWFKLRSTKEKISRKTNTVIVVINFISTTTITTILL
jgi:hypothetical protein